MKKILFSLLTLFFSMTSLAYAQPIQDNNFLIGTWQLISVMNINLLTGEKTYPYGLHPKGYLNYLPDGYMSVILISENRPIINPQQSTTQEEATQLYRTMTSYAGTYTVQNGIIVHHILVAWNQKWNNTDQKRYYQLNGKNLILTAMKPANNTRSIFQWRKMDKLAV